LLDEHTRIHTGDLPFFCSACSKSFTTASGLKQHFRRHETCRNSSAPGAFSISATGFDPSKSGGLILTDSDSVLLADSILAP
jgi:uncharacterized Zn-finger protein